MLEEYLKKFSKLRTDKNKNRWSALTRHQAPHKPFLLLSVIDLLAQGIITNNFIKPSFDLIDAFNRYWSNVMPIGKTTSMAYPFPRLKTDGFWHLVPNLGFENQVNIDFSSMVRVQEILAGAKMDTQLFNLMVHKPAREQFRAVLITTYFAAEIHPLLVDLGEVNLAAYEYSCRILRVAEERDDFNINTGDEDKAKKARDQGFRKAIVTLYNHRCALCGIRMLTPEGHTVVEAAHIKPWHKSQDDSTSNGMALCRLCHWSFDEGLMSVGKNYEVLVSNQVRTNQNMPGPILTFADRPIFTPVDSEYWPNQTNLNWHRNNTFMA